MFISNICDNRIKAALELYNQRMIEKLPTDEELSKITFSKAFEKKTERLLSMQRKAYYGLINTVGKRAAIIILALIISLTATTFSVKAVREAVVEFITETYEKFTRVSTNKPEPIPNEFKKAAPRYVPEGYIIQEEQDYEVLYKITYINDENNPILYDQQIQLGTTYDANTENVTYERVKINSLEGIAYVQQGCSTVIFADEYYFYTVQGILPMDEIIKMAESIPIE